MERRGRSLLGGRGAEETEGAEKGITGGTEKRSRTEVGWGGSISSYRLDVVVEHCVVVEIKSVAALVPVHQAQLLTYMRIADCPIGLLINFNVPRLIDGVKGLVNGAASS